MVASLIGHQSYLGYRKVLFSVLSCSLFTSMISRLELSLKYNTYCLLMTVFVTANKNIDEKVKLQREIDRLNSWAMK